MEGSYESEDVEINLKEAKLSDDGREIEGVTIINHDPENHILIDSIAFSWVNPSEQAKTVTVGLRNAFFQASGGKDGLTSITNIQASLRKGEEAPLHIQLSSPIGAGVNIIITYQKISSAFTLGSTKKVQALLSPKNQGDKQAINIQMPSIQVFQESLVYNKDTTTVEGVYVQNKNNFPLNIVGVGVVSNGKYIDRKMVFAKSLVIRSSDGLQMLTEPVSLGPKETMKFDSIELSANVPRITLIVQFDDGTKSEFELELNSQVGSGTPTTVTEDNNGQVQNEYVSHSLVKQQITANQKVYVVPSVQSNNFEVELKKQEEQYARMYEEAELHNAVEEIKYGCIDTCAFEKPLSSASYELSVEVDSGTAFYMDSIT